MQCLNQILAACARRWRQCHYWYRVLQPARASLLASGLAAFLFLNVDEGAEVLRRLVKNETISSHLHPDVLLMLAGLFITGLVSWGWARLLLNCAFLGTRGTHHNETANRVRRWFRRICGLLPSLGLAAAFLKLAFEPQPANRTGCLVLAGFSAAIGVLLFIFFERMRRKTPKHYSNVADIRADRKTLGAVLFATGVSILLFIIFTASPVKMGELFGSSAVLLFALASWISVGSWLIYFGSRYRVPVFTVLLVSAVVFSLWNDNHQVRLLGPEKNPAPDFYEALDRWHDAATNNFVLAPGQKQPLYLVAAAGGGIRAACWTASVLTRLEDEAGKANASFAGNTFALSGVSGGSLGEVTFVTLLAHAPPGSYQTTAAALLDHDFLASDLSRMAFADLFQRFLPFRVPVFDRARSLEDAWTAAWPGRELDQSLGDLYARATNRSLPHLLLNGTSVETGKRIITSDLLIRPRVWENGPPFPGEFLDVISAAEKLQTNAIRLSTAVHQSARFTYFSPAGTFPDGTRIVDGGYFENSGATTLMDALRAVQQHIAKKGWTDVEPRLVLIDNDPTAESNTPKKHDLLSEALSPIWALLNTRDARGSYAEQQAEDYNGQARPLVYEFHLTPSAVSPPLGWTLSQRSTREMVRQLEAQTNTISQIVASLPRRK